MMEQKIAFTSKSYSLLTLVCEGLRALIFPFIWQMVYIPVLPNT
jgi:hypothetical protein